MRQRLSQDKRRAEIVKQARAQFHKRGYGATEMEDIRAAAGLSRGGLYHHFANKQALLDACIADETRALADHLAAAPGHPLVALLTAGSAHLGAAPGLVETLQSADEHLLYLGYLERALAAHIQPALAARLADHVAPGGNPAHIAELFLTVNAHINRRQCLGDWSGAEAAGFAATALCALAPLLADPAALAPLIARLRGEG